MKYLIKLYSENILILLISSIIGVLISYFFIGMLIMPLYTFVIIGLILAGIYFGFLLYENKNQTFGNLLKEYNFNEKYTKYFITFIFFIFFILLSFLVKNVYIIKITDYQNTNLNYIQNIKVDKYSAIEKFGDSYKLRKNPVKHHPYMGILSFGKLNIKDKFIVELEGTLKGESQIGIVLTEKSVFPTEYIELLAATYKNSIGLNNVDGKGKYGIDEKKGNLFQDKKFKLILEYDMSKNQVCSYYNSKINSLFNKKCSSLPNNLNLGFVGFKMVDDDISNNNLYVPEITNFKVYSLRF